MTKLEQIVGDCVAVDQGQNYCTATVSEDYKKISNSINMYLYNQPFCNVNARQMW